MSPDASGCSDHRQPEPQTGAQQRVGVLGRGGDVRAARLATLEQCHEINHGLLIPSVL